jgi:hypothetical protein
VRYLDEKQLALARARREPLEEFAPGPATTHEKELRRQLCDA